MEPYNQNTSTPAETPKERNKSGRVMGGLLIVFIGLIFLAREAGADFPRWIFSFKTMLLALGVYLGFRHSFRGFVWVIPILISGVMFLDYFYPYYDLNDFIWPMIIIGVGLYIALRPSASRNRDSFKKKWDAGTEQNPGVSDDYLDSTVIFGSVKKNIISKNFRGGEAVTVFGGTEINLMQADVNGKIVLDLTQIFSGSKLIIPPHWKIQSDELVAIFGGIEDKRPILNDASGVDHSKVVILRGTCLFGGIDIKSY